MQSSQVLELVKRDLEELGSAVRSEASSVVSSTGAALEKTLKLDEPESTASSVKRSLSSFLGQVNTVLNPSPEPDSDAEALVVTEGGGGAVALTRLQQALYELQRDEKTFTAEPEASTRAKYECWLEVADDEFTEERLTRHLHASSALNDQYQRLVPDRVSHQLFWKRYLFRRALVHDELAHKEVEERKRQQQRRASNDEHNLQWEKGTNNLKDFLLCLGTLTYILGACPCANVTEIITEDFATDIDLTEEEQTLLLEQYEKERKAKDSTAKSTSPTDSSEEVIFSSPKRKEPTKKTTKTSSCTSLDTKSTNSSSDGDWEKISTDATTIVEAK